MNTQDVIDFLKSKLVYLVAASFIIAFTAWTQSNQPTSSTDQSVKVVLDEKEQLKLDNMRLRQANFELSVIQTRAQLSLELDSLIKKIETDHGNPEGIRFDPQTYTLKIEAPVKK